MNFSDIFKSSFLENATAISLFDMLVALLLAFSIGLFIFFVYKKSYSGLMYSASFGTTLIALTMITTLVILAVTSNIVLSLGMVGALSIVRFRTAIKEPMDIAFLFWSIAAGIVLAVIGSVMVGLVLIIFSNRKNVLRPYILVVHCQDDEIEKKASQFVKEQVDAFSLKSKSIKKQSIELNYEVRIKDQSALFINELSNMEGITYAVLVSYNGDYMG